MKFNYSSHWEGSFSGHFDYKALFGYCSNKKAQEYYLKSLKLIECDDEGNEITTDTPKFLIEEEKKSLNNSLNIISNQMIVYIYSRYEFMVEDFANCLFISNPNKLKRIIEIYPEYKDSLGFSFTEFIKTKDKEEYIKILCTRITSRILSKKPEKVIKRLACVCSIRISDENLEILNDLMKKRNSIVHEGTIYEIGIDDLDKYYNALEVVLTNIAKCLESEGVEVIDNGVLRSN